MTIGSAREFRRSAVGLKHQQRFKDPGGCGRAIIYWKHASLSVSQHKKTNRLFRWLTIPLFCLSNLWCKGHIMTMYLQSSKFREKKRRSSWKKVTGKLSNNEEENDVWNRPTEPRNFLQPQITFYTVYRLPLPTLYRGSGQIKTRLYVIWPASQWRSQSRSAHGSLGWSGHQLMIPSKFTITVIEKIVNLLREKKLGEINNTERTRIARRSTMREKGWQKFLRIIIVDLDRKFEEYSFVLGLYNCHVNYTRNSNPS